MGWFASSPSSTDQKQSSVESPKPSKDGGFIAPDRSARALCWEGRDNFFACLDKNKIIDSVKESEKAASLCGSESAQFEKNCATSWVSGDKRCLFCRPEEPRKRKRMGLMRPCVGAILQEATSHGIPARSDSQEVGKGGCHGYLFSAWRKGFIDRRKRATVNYTLLEHSGWLCRVSISNRHCSSHGVLCPHRMLTLGMAFNTFLN